MPLWRFSRRGGPANKFSFARLPAAAKMLSQISRFRGSITLSPKSSSLKISGSQPTLESNSFSICVVDLVERMPSSGLNVRECVAACGCDGALAIAALPSRLPSEILSRRVVGQPGGRSLRAVVERSGWHHRPRYEPRGPVLDHSQPRRRHGGPIRGVGRCWARSRGLEDIRWAANDRGMAALPGRPDQW
jgi:hypothetical protein